MESGSGTCSTDGQQGEQVTITINDHLLAKLNLLDDAINKPKKLDTQQNTKPRIQRSAFLHDMEKRFEGFNFYRPKVVSFGPLHHEWLQEGEEVKLKLAAHFMLENRIDRKAALIKIMNIIKALKDCYDENALEICYELNYFKDDSDLAFMFLIDGCALLHFMERVVSGGEDSLLQEDHVTYDFLLFATRDMFMPGSQLPYQLLRLLTCSIDVERRRRSTEQAIVEFTHLVSPCEILPVQTPGTDQSEDPLHLLDLLHRTMKISVVGNRVRRLKHHHSKQATFRSAKEFKSFGIMLKPSATSSMNGVSFHQGFFSGTLSLPSITVDDSSMCMLLNLIAYEMCPDFKNELEVTSYVCFLDSLLDQSEDVRELRQASILRNHLDSDEEVVELFHKMRRCLKPNPAKYKDIKGELYMQHKNTGIIRTWVADVKKDYFSNPWTFLAVCGAVLGLVLSLIQAWYAVKSYDKC